MPDKAGALPSARFGEAEGLGSHSWNQFVTGKMAQRRFAVGIHHFPRAMDGVVDVALRFALAAKQALIDDNGVSFGIGRRRAFGRKLQFEDAVPRFFDVEVESKTHEVLLVGGQCLRNSRPADEGRFASAPRH
jgi:hypothetical protein